MKESTKQKWKQIIAEYEQTNLSAKAFCHQKDLSYVAFLRQRKNYQKSAQDTTIQFLPLMIIPTPSELIRFSCNGLELQVSKHDLPYILKAMQ